MSKREVDSKLWEHVQQCSKGEISDKLQSVDIIFKQHYQLPEECLKLIDSLAKQDQPKEVRIFIVKCLIDIDKIPYGMYKSLFKILSEDSDNDVQKSLTTLMLNRMSNFAKSMESVILSSFKDLGSIDFASSPMLKNLEALTQNNPLLKSLESINFAVSPMLKNLEALTQNNPLLKSLESINFAVSPMLKNLEAINMSINIPALKNLQSPQLPNFIPTKQLTSITGFSESMTRELSKDLLRNSISYYGTEELEEIKKPTKKLEKKKTLDLIEKLKKCGIGLKHWREYEDICEEIFSYCFTPPLEEPLIQEFTEDKIYRRDLIFYIPYGVGGFCQFLSQFGMGIVIDCKNYSDLISSNEVRIATKYLGKKKLTTFGLIVTRKGLDEGGKKAQRDLWINSDELVICLNDEDLVKMLELKENEDEPWKVIDLSIKKFRAAD